MTNCGLRFSAKADSPSNPSGWSAQASSAALSFSDVLHLQFSRYIHTAHERAGDRTFIGMES
jgi:hypothetical protein